jgi:hypothetical protein
MKQLVFGSLMCCLILTAKAQQTGLPYFEIPKEPDHYSAGAVTSRMIDGLGFRYYWATDSLRQADLDFKPGADARTTFETLIHIYQLSIIIVNSTTATVNQLPDTKNMSFDDVRKNTLENFYRASQNVRNSKDVDFNKFKAVFKRNEGTREFPFWNMLNGPIADALWHVGQVVSFRRSSGNPLSDKPSVFTGTVNK